MPGYVWCIKRTGSTLQMYILQVLSLYPGFYILQVLSLYPGCIYSKSYPCTLGVYTPSHILVPGFYILQVLSLYPGCIYSKSYSCTWVLYTPSPIFVPWVLYTPSPILIPWVLYTTWVRLKKVLIYSNIPFYGYSSDNRRKFLKT